MTSARAEEHTAAECHAYDMIRWCKSAATQKRRRARQLARLFLLRQRGMHGRKHKNGVDTSYYVTCSVHFLLGNRCTDAVAFCAHAREGVHSGIAVPQARSVKLLSSYDTFSSIHAYKQCRLSVTDPQLFDTVLLLCTNRADWPQHEVEVGMPYCTQHPNVYYVPYLETRGNVWTSNPK